MNFARLNHILIPTTKDERDRFRNSRAGRFFAPVGGLWRALSEDGRAVMLLWLFAGVASLGVRINQVYLLWSGLTGVVVASFLVRRFLKLDGVEIEVEAPPRTAVGDEVTFLVTLRNRGDGEFRTIRIGGPFLPWDGRFSGELPSVRSLAPRSSQTVEVRARFSARGEHHLDAFGAFPLVPFGITVGRGVWSAGVRFLVVPRMANVKQLSLPLARRYQPGGVSLASRTGEAMELFGVRQYQPGDPVRDLHGRSWARVGYPVVREYRQEYFTRVGVVVDTDFRQKSESQVEATISLAAGAIAHLCRGEALIDLLLVGGELYRLTLGRSLGFLDQALDLLACVDEGPAFDAAAVEAELAPHAAQLSCVVLVTPSWDGARSRLAEALRTRGLGCRALHVRGRRDPGPAQAEAGVTSIDEKAIRAGRELVL